MHHLPCLLLIRHAQSENNAQAQEYRIPDPNITPLGVLQSAKLSQAVMKLSPTKLYCSPFLRSLETTRPIAIQTGLTPFIRQDIYEQGGCHRGFLPDARVAEPGMGRRQIEKQYLGWGLDDRIVDNGWYDLDHFESHEESRVRANRVRNWFESETMGHTSRDRVAMVIHADFKMRLIETFLDDEINEDLFGDIANTSISRLSYSQGRWKLDYWNVYSHLSSDEVTF
jgi:2,3-bisphosphoglycerate-dependent phosphoglycerate mutase